MKYPIITTTFSVLLLSYMANQVTVGENENSSLSKPEAADLLRFTNGDTLHGSFLGFGENLTVNWKNLEAPDPIRFSTKKIHRIVLNHGHAYQQADLNSTLSLVNGDLISGSITSADPKTITLTSHHLGTINIPRNTVSKITPNPHGPKLFYYGPMNPDGWKVIQQEEPKKDEDKAAENPDGQKQVADWKHIANAWYSVAEKHGYLVRENALPEKCRLTFKLAWRGSRLHSNIAIHADLDPPALGDKVDARNHMAATLGKAYVINISSHSAALWACTVDEAGKPHNIRINPSASLDLTNKQEALVELRINKADKQLLLYLNGQFKTKWDLGDEYQGKGNAFAISNTYKSCDLRISDIIISEWNGLEDSAQSMRTKQRDIILLTNGLDRFSGTFNHITDDMVSFTGAYGTAFTMPVNEVQEIHFATNQLRKLPEQADDTSVYFHILPHGRISGTPGTGSLKNTRLTSCLLGEISLDTSYVNIIDFSHQNNLLDLWDDNF